MENTVFSGSFLRVTVEESAGQRYERAYVRDGVCVVVLTDDGQIRFVREYNFMLKTTQTKLVSGYLEDGEDPLTCAKRELSEELGLSAAQWDLFLVSRSEENTVLKTQYIFKARELSQGQAHPEQGESILGYEDVPLLEVRSRALAGDFGTTATAYALLKITVL